MAPLEWIRGSDGQLSPYQPAPTDLAIEPMLRQGDAEVFKLYSQAKLGMMREALAKLDRAANERDSNFRAARVN